MGLTLIYGIIVAVPTLLIAGPLFARTLRHLEAGPSELFKPATTETATGEMPGTFVSFACALLPVALIAGVTLIAALNVLPKSSALTIAFFGHPMVVLLLSLAFATVALGASRGMQMESIMLGYGIAIRDVAGILLTVAGAGALKQVFVDSGVNQEMGGLLNALPVPPLVLGWLLALVIRIAVGSATVAGLTAAGLVLPLIASSGVDPNWMVLAIGAGSLMCSHVSDAGFWLFKEYFNLSLAATFRSWSLMETIVGIFGLLFVLILDMWI